MLSSDKVGPAKLLSRHGIKPQEGGLAAFAHQNQQHAFACAHLKDVRISTDSDRCGKRRIRQIALVAIDLVENCCKDSDKARDHDEGRAEQQALQLCLDSLGFRIERGLTRPSIPIFRL